MQSDEYGIIHRRKERFMDWKQIDIPKEELLEAIKDGVREAFLDQMPLTSDIIKCIKTAVETSFPYPSEIRDNIYDAVKEAMKDKEPIYDED